MDHTGCLDSAVAPSAVSKACSGTCRKVKGASLDFHNMPPIPEGKLALAKRASDITLKGAQTKAATLLPADAQYQVASGPLALQATGFRPGSGPCTAQHSSCLLRRSAEHCYPVQEACALTAQPGCRSAALSRPLWCAQAHRLAEFFLLPGMPITRSVPRKAGAQDGDGQGGAEGATDHWGGYGGRISGARACLELAPCGLWQPGRLLALR